MARVGVGRRALVADRPESLAPDGGRLLTPRVQRWTAPIAGHPLLATALVSTLVALGHVIWIWNHRLLGAFDPDEAGYLAAALRYERTFDLLRPWAFVREVGGTGTGPMVPLLSVPFLLVGPRDPRTAMLVQPLLSVLISVSIAGITLHLKGRPYPAILAGTSFLALPMAALATQSYWLGTGATAAMVGSMWALLTSDRCANGRIWLYGFLLGLMLLTRTMMLGFLPAMALAGVVVAGRDRRRLLRLAGAFGVAAVVAGPWWIVNWTSIFDYLLSYGYGERAGLFGSGGIPQRLGFRFERILDGTGFGWVGNLAIAAAVVAGLLLATLGLRTAERRFNETQRSELALVLAVAVGLAALVSTSNNGVWFELPLVGLAIPLVVAAGSRAPWPLRAAASCAVVVALVLVSLRAWWVLPPGGGRPAAAHYEYGFEQYDPRFGPMHRDELRDAAADWRQVNEAVVTALHRLDRGEEVFFTMSGNMQLLNSNSVSLAAELEGWGPIISIPDTTLPARRRVADLSPVWRDDDGNAHRRVLVLALHDEILFTPDRDVAELASQAEDLGWVQAERIPLPLGGSVSLLVHPDNP